MRWRSGSTICTPGNAASATQSLRRLHAQHRAKRRIVPRDNPAAELFNLRVRRRRAVAEQTERQIGSRGQRRLFHRQLQQRRPRRPVGFRGTEECVFCPTVTGMDEDIL